MFDGNREVQAATVEDATDAVVQMLKYGHAGDDAAAQIELRGFQSTEADGFLRATNNGLRASQRDASALVEEGIDPAIIRTIRQRRYDIPRATVSEPVVEVVNGVPQGKITVEIPRLDATGKARAEITVGLHPEMKPPLMVRLMQKIKVAIQKIIQDFGGSFDAIAFNLRLNREIRAISRETGVPIDIVRHQFTDAADDLHFGLLEALVEERHPA